jgi:hypothetical protein
VFPFAVEAWKTQGGFGGFDGNPFPFPPMSNQHFSFVVCPLEIDDIFTATKSQKKDSVKV